MRGNYSQSFYVPNISSQSVQMKRCRGSLHLRFIKRIASLFDLNSCFFFKLFFCHPNIHIFVGIVFGSYYNKRKKKKKKETRLYSLQKKKFYNMDNVLE